MEEKQQNVIPLQGDKGATGPIRNVYRLDSRAREESQDLRDQQVFPQ